MRMPNLGFALIAFALIFFAGCSSGDLQSKDIMSVSDCVASDSYMTTCDYAIALEARQGYNGQKTQPIPLISKDDSCFLVKIDAVIKNGGDVAFAAVCIA